MVCGCANEICTLTQTTTQITWRQLSKQTNSQRTWTGNQTQRNLHAIPRTVVVQSNMILVSTQTYAIKLWIVVVASRFQSVEKFFDRIESMRPTRRVRHEIKANARRRFAKKLRRARRTRQRCNDANIKTHDHLMKKFRMLWEFIFSWLDCICWNRFRFRSLKFHHYKHHRKNKRSQVSKPGSSCNATDRSFWPSSRPAKTAIIQQTTSRIFVRKIRTLLIVKSTS